MPGSFLQACPLVCGARCLAHVAPLVGLFERAIVSIALAEKLLARGVACPWPTGRIPTGSGAWDCMFGLPPGQRSNRGKGPPGIPGGCTHGRIGRHQVTVGPAGPRLRARRFKRIAGRRAAMQHPRYCADTIWQRIARCAMSCRASVVGFIYGAQNPDREARVKARSASKSSALPCRGAGVRWKVRVRSLADFYRGAAKRAWHAVKRAVGAPRSTLRARALGVPKKQRSWTRCKVRQVVARVVGQRACRARGYSPLASFSSAALLLQGVTGDKDMPPSTVVCGGARADGRREEQTGRGRGNARGIPAATRK